MASKYCVGHKENKHTFSYGQVRYTNIFSVLDCLNSFGFCLKVWHKVGLKLHWCGLSRCCIVGEFVHCCCVCVSGRISGPADPASSCLLFCLFKITLEGYSYRSNKVVTFVSDWQTSACVGAGYVYVCLFSLEATLKYIEFQLVLHISGSCFVSEFMIFFCRS